MLIFLKVETTQCSCRTRDCCCSSTWERSAVLLLLRLSKCVKKLLKVSGRVGSGLLVITLVIHHSPDAFPHITLLLSMCSSVCCLYLYLASWMPFFSSLGACYRQSFSFSVGSSPGFQQGPHCIVHPELLVRKDPNWLSVQDSISAEMDIRKYRGRFLLKISNLFEAVPLLGSNSPAGLKKPP